MAGNAAERYFRRPLALLLAASLFAMMALVVVDVFGRYFFDTPIRGSYEITQCLMALVVFFGFPLVTESREHITVGLFSVVGGPRARRARAVVIDGVSAGVVAFMALRLWEQGQSLAKSRQVSGLTNIPIAPFAYFMSVLAMVVAIILIVHAIRAITAPEAPRP